MKARSLECLLLSAGALLAGNSLASAQNTVRASVTWNGGETNDWSNYGNVSADGAIVAFDSYASNLVLNDTNQKQDVFVHEIASGLTERVSVDSSGAEGNGSSYGGMISADGRFVVFTSAATNLVANDLNGMADIFVHDLVTGTTELVSVDSSGAAADSDSEQGVLSSDGRYVAFRSLATNLVANDVNDNYDVFVHDRVTGFTECVSVDPSGVPGNDWSADAVTSADGRYLAFTSLASNLVAGDGNDSYDVFVRDRTLGTTERVSVDSNGVEADLGGTQPSLSADGMSVAFTSAATNLVAGDTNQAADAFVHSRASGATVRVSVDSSGLQANGPSYAGWAGAISEDGLTVAFTSLATNLVSGDTNGIQDSYVHWLVGGTTARASVDSSGGQANGANLFPMISGNGRHVLFTSWANNLVPNDTNSLPDVFLHGPFASASWTNFGSGFPGTRGIPGFTVQAIPQLGMPTALDIENSSGMYTVAAYFLGFQQTSIRSTWGGDLVVVPLITQLIGLAPWGGTLLGEIPNDANLCGCAVELQVIEADPGASKGVSFTPGLELVLGH